MGGDCCDPDAPGSSVGYYDFQATAWQEIGGDDPRRWPKEMAERMGHAVVALPERDRVWVMGGWSQNGGTCDDIWEFDGSTWTMQKARCEACLCGATATKEEVWRVGGFLDPGGKATATAMLYDRNNAPVEVGVKIASGRQYCASALFVLGGSDLPSGVGTFFESASRSYKHVMFFFSKERHANIEVSTAKGSSAQGVFLPHDYYHIQAAVFQGSAFLRTLRPDRNEAGSRLVSYLVRVEK